MKSTKWVGGLIALAGFASLVAQAQPEGGANDWLRRYNLDLAEKYAAKVHAHREQIAAGAILSETPLQQTLMGASYSVGQEWDVIAFQNIDSEIAKGDAIRDGEARWKPAGFHYRVSSVNPLEIEVTQKPVYGLKIIDPEVESITLKYDSHLKQVTRTYHLANGRTADFAAGDLRNRLIPLEAFPLEVPNLDMPLPEAARKIPALPGRFADLAKKAGYAPDLAKSSWIEDDDLFGRGIEILWQKNTPWPSYLKTARGTSILVRSHLSQGGT